MTEVKMPIIGYMQSPYLEKFGIPRQPNLVQVESFIEMVAPYNDLSAFDGIEAFSHLWLIWQFHDNKNQHQQEKFRPQVRPPRLGGNQKMGVFATRSMYRPSPLGLSVVQFKRVEKHGKSVRVYVTGSDLLNATPILDIKPYIQYSDAVIDAQSGYAQQQPELKAVIWSKEAEQHKQIFLNNQTLTLQHIQELEAVLSLDPRPAYQDDSERLYGMSFAGINAKFKVIAGVVEIQALQQGN